MKKFLAIIVLLIVIVFLGFYLGRNMIVEKAVEAGGEHALGVETTLKSAEVGLTHGRVELNSYKIDNPEGFEKEHFMTIDHFLFDIEAGSIFDDAVVIDSFIIDGLEMNIEQIDTKGNYKVLMDHIKQLDLGESSESNTKLIIKKAAFRNLAVNTDLTVMGKKQHESTVELDNFELTNIGGDDGMTVTELSAFMVKTVVNKAIKSGKLPAGVSGKVDELKDEGKKKLEEGVKNLLGK